MVNFLQSGFEISEDLIYKLILGLDSTPFLLFAFLISALYVYILIDLVCVCYSYTYLNLLWLLRCLDLCRIYSGLARDELKTLKSCVLVDEFERSLKSSLTFVSFSIIEFLNFTTCNHVFHEVSFQWLKIYLKLS